MTKWSADWNEVLENDGYRLLETAKGIAAVSICAQYEEPIHLLLTDRRYA